MVRYFLYITTSSDLISLVNISRDHLQNNTVEFPVQTDAFYIYKAWAPFFFFLMLWETGNWYDIFHIKFSLTYGKELCETSSKLCS